MYLIAGLGNPEPEYNRTRHNMGFDTINEIAKKYEIAMTRIKFNGIYGSGTIEGEKVILLKPQTFMNLSGECIKPFVDFYKIPFENVLVIYDDMDTKIGNIRIRKQGGPGTHNGAKSVVHELGSEEFPRIRVGIGRPVDEYDAIDYVIGKINDETYEALCQGVKKAAEAAVDFLKRGIEHAMNHFN
ncbi:MAG: aminoacyl-tRNA hydrolase [Clostridia bacterium]|nr:aminoacyl-tRNA hydrolase [Clostridia bacterium]